MRPAMKNLYQPTAVIALALACLGPASADRASADACAAELSETGRKIYIAVAAELQPDDDLASKMKSVVRPLVMGGEISRGDAKAGAKEAKICLEKIHAD